MLNKLQNEWRTPVIFWLMIGMMVSLFTSRYLLSLSMILFIVTSFLHNRHREQLNIFFRTPILWGMSLLFLLPLVSGLWSEDREQWMDISRIKLPLLFLPLAFAAPFGFNATHWNKLTWAFLSILFVSTCWSLFLYVSDVTAVNESYLRAKTMTTPLENDHVRFSWLVSIGILLSAWMARERRIARNYKYWILLFVTVWLIVFLHLLAARTGLLSFYLMLAGAAIWFIIMRRKKKLAIILVALLVTLPLVAYWLLPSFRNRVKYMRYDYSYFIKGDYLPGSNDAVRLVSIQAGWEVMNKNPVTGVGFGDVKEAVHEVYATRYPGMLESDKILPGSEWMMYGSGCGWPGLLIFTAVMIIPFCMKARNRLSWCLINATAAFSFMFDIGLEVQFGVFVYCFIIVWWWKWLVKEKI